MNLLVLSCKTMRDGLIVSGAFLFTGLSLLIAARYLVPHDYFLPQITSGLAVVLLIFSPIILISTYLTRVYKQRHNPE